MPSIFGLIKKAFSLFWSDQNHFGSHRLQMIYFSLSGLLWIIFSESEVELFLKESSPCCVIQWWILTVGHLLRNWGVLFWGWGLKLWECWSAVFRMLIKSVGLDIWRYEHLCWVSQLEVCTIISGVRAVSYPVSCDSFTLIYQI